MFSTAIQIPLLHNPFSSSSASPIIAISGTRPPPPLDTQEDSHKDCPPPLPNSQQWPPVLLLFSPANVPFSSQARVHNRKPNSLLLSAVPIPILLPLNISSL